MSSWGNWYYGHLDEEIEFVQEILEFLQKKLDDSKEDETIKKKRLNIQINSLKYYYSI